MDKVYDIVIIGTGPAGLNASLYAKRAGLDFVLLKNKYLVDSQIVNTYEIENYLGFTKLSGQELYDKMLNHILSMDIKIVDEKAEEIDTNEKIKTVKTKNNIYKTKTVILATGAVSQKLNIEGENELEGRGLSYCATCDGAFYKNRITAVVGGGDVAVEDAIFLSRLCEKVYLIVRKDCMRATKVLQDEINSKSNVEILYNTEVKKVLSNEMIYGINIINNKTNIESEIKIDGLFIGVGTAPVTELLNNKVDMDNNYIIADETCETSIKGIYACGDVRKKQLKQVVTALSDGANAITSIQRYLVENA